jgi:2-polyprenyl-3-methyl-5-hydroxy-6-metoxy-1,4-benzoquinol methylase
MELSTESILASNDYRFEPCQLNRVRFVLTQAIAACREKGVSPQEFNVLDFGCGTGNISLALSQLGFKVVGLDVDPVNIDTAAAKSRGLPNLPTFALVQQADLARMQFDFVVCSEVLEHTEMPQMILDTIKEVTMHNGRICVTIPNGYGLSEWLGLKKALYKHKVGLGWLKNIRNKLSQYRHQSMLNHDCPHRQWWTLGQFRELLEHNGLQIPVSRSAFFCFPFIYVTFFCIFIRPGSRIFRWLENVDLCVTDRIPLSWAGGWFFVVQKEDGISRMRESG